VLVELRDYFAGWALNALMNISDVEAYEDHLEAAKLAYHFADAMIEARKTQESKESVDSTQQLKAAIAEIVKVLDALNGAALSQKGTAQLTEELRQLSAV